ncbi:MAG: chemotaxis protein CheW [Pseudomonadota bacterium]
MSTDKSAIHLLYLTTKEHQFCLPLAEVERLLLLMEIQSVPQAPDYLVGFMNLYGEAVPVLDLALRIGIEHKDDYTVQTPVILINNGEQRSALIIDYIEGVKTINSDQLRGEKLFAGAKPPLKATITSNHGTALLLDTKRILDIDLSAMGIPLILGEEILSLCRIVKQNE